MRFLMTTDTVGGVWTFTTELCGALLAQKHTIALVSFGRLPSDVQSEWATEQHETYPDHFQFTPSTVPLEWTQENGRSMPEGEAILARIAEQFRPDLLFSNQFCYGASLLDLPRLVVVHSDVLSWARACKLAALTPTPWLSQYKTLVQAGLTRADKVVAPTKAVLRDLSLDFDLPKGGTVIANGRSLTMAQPSYDLPKKRLQAMSAGRLWDAAKGLDLLQNCDLPLPVLVAGETQFGEEPQRELPANVRLLGLLSPDELQRHLLASALYLCTSRYEPFGLAVLEAGLCGCAIVARDLPSLREVWGDDALYFRDAAGLTMQVRRLVEDVGARVALGERARRRAATYTVARMTDAYTALAEVAVEEHRGGHVA